MKPPTATKTFGAKRLFSEEVFIDHRSSCFWWILWVELTAAQSVDFDYRVCGRTRWIGPGGLEYHAQHQSLFGRSGPCAASAPETFTESLLVPELKAPIKRSSSSLGQICRFRLLSLRHHPFSRSLKSQPTSARTTLRWHRKTTTRKGNELDIFRWIYPPRFPPCQLHLRPWRRQPRPRWLTPPHRIPLVLPTSWSERPCPLRARLKQAKEATCTCCLAGCSKSLWLC